MGKDIIPERAATRPEIAYAIASLLRLPSSEMTLTFVSILNDTRKKGLRSLADLQKLLDYLKANEPAVLIEDRGEGGMFPHLSPGIQGAIVPLWIFQDVDSVAPIEKIESCLHLVQSLPDSLAKVRDKTARRLRKLIRDRRRAASASDKVPPKPYDPTDEN